MLRKARYAAVFIFSMCTLLNAKDDNGKSILLLGDSAASLGRGGTGVASYGSDMFYLNPASIGGTERIESGIQFGTLEP